MKVWVWLALLPIRIVPDSPAAPSLEMATLVGPVVSLRRAFWPAARRGAEAPKPALIAIATAVASASIRARPRAIGRRD